MDFLLLLTLLYRDEAAGKISTEKNICREERPREGGGERIDREIGNKRTEKGAIRERSIIYCTLGLVSIKYKN
jgi:hypothetical protein